MTRSRQDGSSPWKGLFETAFSCASAPESAVLFLEQREDLAIDLDGEGGTQEIHTAWSGLAARDPGPAQRVVFQSAPEPQDAERLLRRISSPESIPERSPERIGGPVDPSASRLDSAGLRSLLSLIAAEISRAAPAAAVSVRGVAVEQRILLAGKQLGVVADTRAGTRIRAECRLPGGDTSSATAVELAFSPTGAREPIASVVDPLLARAEARLAAREAPSGQKPVVFAPGAGGILVHEIIGHALEADTVLEGESWLGRSDAPPVPAELSVLDDPRRGRVAWRIDDEGEPARAVALIRDGGVASWLHDLRSARASGRAPTGHGRSSTFRDPVRPRMGCTFIAAGSLSPEEIVADVRDGIYVRRMRAGTTDTRTGRAVFRVTDSDRIRDGRIEEPLTPHLLFVEGPRVLPTMNRIADDLAFDRCIGSCHRRGQPLATSVGTPTFWIGVANVFL